MLQSDKKTKREGKDESTNDMLQHVSGKRVTNTVFIAITICVFIIIIGNGTPFYNEDYICGECERSVDWDEIAWVTGGLSTLYFLLPFILDNEHFKPLYTFVEKAIIKWREIRD